MLELALILFGATAIGLGWFWGGVTEARTTAVWTGIPAILLSGIVIFSAAASSPTLPVWAFAAAAAILAGLVAAEIGWGVIGDRSLGLYALFFAAAAALVVGGLAIEADEFTIQALGALIAAGIGALIFIASALLPHVKGFRNFAGWAILVAGAVVAFLGFAPSLEITL